MTYDYFIPLAEVHCPALPSWDGKMCNVTGLSVGDFANCSCAEGTQFSTKQLYFEAECTVYGEWSEKVPSCVGKLLKKYT